MPVICLLNFYRNVQSMREKQGIFNMLAQMPRLIHIDIGHAADDAILWQIAITCPQLRSADYCITFRFAGYMTESHLS